MINKKKIIRIGVYVVLSLLALFLAVLLYLYHHPEKLLPYLAKRIAQKTSTICQIQELSFNRQPLHVQVKGLSFRPDPARQAKGFELFIPMIDADLEFQGSFGQRTLLIKELVISNPTVKLSHDFILPQILSEPEPSFPVRWATRMINYFFFKEIIYQHTKIGNGDLTLALADQNLQFKDIQAESKPDRLLEISCGAELQWLSKGINLILPQVHVATESTSAKNPRQIGGMLQVSDGILEGSDLKFDQLVVEARFDYQPEQKKLSAIQAEMRVEKIRFKGLKNLNPLQLRLTLSGDCGLADFQWTVPHWAVTLQEQEQKIETEHRRAQPAVPPVPLGPLLDLKGSLQFGLMPFPKGRLEVLEGRVLSQKLPALASPRIKKKIAGLNLSGPLSLHGRLEAQKEKEPWTGQSDLVLGFQQNPISFLQTSLRLNGMLSGEVQMQGPFTKPVFTAKLEAADTRLAGTALQGVEIQPFRAAGQLTGVYPLLQIQSLDLQIPQAAIKAGGKEVVLRQISVQAAKGQIDMSQTSLLLPETRIETSFLKGLVLNLAFQNKELNAELTGRELDLAPLARELKLLPADWEAKGLQRFALQAHLDQTLKKGKYSAVLECDNYSFGDRTGAWLGDKIRYKAGVQGEIGTETDTVTASVNVEMSEGEMLLDRWYFNMQTNPFIAQGKVKYRFGPKTLDLSEGRLELKGLLACNLEGKVSARSAVKDFDFSLEVLPTALKPVFDQFVREPFKIKQPFLAGLKVGGTFGGRLTFKQQENRKIIKGQWRWQDGELLSEKGDWYIKGVNLDWPLWYATSLSKSAKSKAAGVLSVQAMKLPLLPEQPLNLEFVVQLDQFTVSAPTKLNVPGGTVELGPLTCRNPYTAQPKVKTSLSFKGLDLNPMLSGLWKQGLKGAAEGKLTPMVFDGQNLTTQGRIKADLFGGTILIDDIALVKLLGPSPLLKLNASWENLSLLDMTKGTEFGSIQGILRGYVKDFELAAGQVQRFDLLAESVAKKDVPQKMSQRAVDSIARIGGGQSPFIGMAKVYANFIQELPYKKIGIRAKLENDLFCLNGVIKEGQNEYLIKKNITGVDVITRGHCVGFKDLVKRVQGVMAKPKSPETR